MIRARILNFFKKDYNIRGVLVISITVIFFVKIILAYSLRDSFFDRGNSHTAIFALAKNIAESNMFSIEMPILSIDYEPLYPFLIGLAFKIFGYNWFGPTFLQIVISITGGILLFNVLMKITNNALIGLFTMLYYLCYPYYFLYSLSIFDSNLFGFLLILLFYFLMCKDWGVSNWILTGITIGLLLLTRGTIITILPGIVFFICYNAFIGNKDFNKIFQSLLTVVLFTIITISPWVIRNYKLTKEIIISTHGPFGLWQGNNQYSYDYLKNNISLDEIYRKSNPPSIVQSYPIKPRDPNDAIFVSNQYKIEAVDYIKENPNQFFKLALVKFVKLWSPIRNPHSSDPSFSSNRARQFLYFGSYFPLLLTLPMGLYFLYKRYLGIFIFFSSVLVLYSLAHMIFIGFTRARIPIDFILIVCLGFLLNVIFERKKEDYISR